MSRDDWYRNKSWSPRIEKRFFEKLQRARSQRDQYLVIQALTLARREPDVARRLVDHYFETRTTEYDDMRALLARADSYDASGDLGQAIEAYKAVLAREAEFPNHQSNTYATLPYFIARNRIESEYAFALQLLQSDAYAATFPIDLFRQQASLALIYDAQGQDDQARFFAKLALGTANIRKSGFRYHQDLGLVGKGDDETVKKMYQLSAA